MTSYTFSPGELVCVVRGKVVEAVLQVREHRNGIVTLDDDSQWYASGLPVAGSSARRMTVLLPGIEAQIKKVGKLLRITELATIVFESVRQRSLVTERDLTRAEGALMELLRARAASMNAADTVAFWARMNQRLDAAERGAVDRVLYDLGIETPDDNS